MKYLKHAPLAGMAVTTAAITTMTEGTSAEETTQTLATLTSQELSFTFIDNDSWADEIQQAKDA